MSDLFKGLYGLLAALPDIVALIKYINKVSGNDIPGAVRRLQHSFTLLDAGKTDDELFAAARAIQDSYANKKEAAAPDPDPDPIPPDPSDSPL